MRKIQGYQDHRNNTAVKVTQPNAEDGDQSIDPMIQFQEHYGFLLKELSSD
jgi:hypothetical protein